MIGKILHFIRVCVAYFPFGTSLVQTYFRLTAKSVHRRRCLRLQRYGFEIYRNVHAIMTGAKIPYWADFGTLLGLVRENGPIPHDDDVDYSLFPETDMARVYNAFKDTCFKLEHGFSIAGELVELSYSYHGVNVDFFKTHVVEGRTGNYVFVTKYDPKTGALKDVVAHERARERVLRVSNRAFGAGTCSCDVSVPDNAEALLTSSYGNWKVPDSSVDGCSVKLPSQFRDIYSGCSLLLAPDIIASLELGGLSEK